MLCFPAFEPHPLLRNPHAQTLAAFFLNGARPPAASRPHRVVLPDGDALVLHDDCPQDWPEGGLTALLIHGLAGANDSPYMLRVAERLRRRGVRTFRMDMRGCGAAAGWSRHPYHAGRSADVAEALHRIARLCPKSPAVVIGFSLGGNQVLKLLGESAGDVPDNVARAAAVCPPIDLHACSDRLRGSAFGLYDRYLTGLMIQRQRESGRQNGRPPIATGDSPATSADRIDPPPRTLYEFDDHFTAPVCGFGTAERYYRACSAEQFVPDIRIPTLILAARDDPLIAFEPFERLRLPQAVRLVATDGGGHIGFIARRGLDPDRWWMDWRLVEWVTPSNRT